MFGNNNRKVTGFITVGFLLFVAQLYWMLLLTQRLTQHPSQSTMKPHQLLESYTTEKLSEINRPFKRIVFWNEAYGNKEYGVGFGRDALRKYGCPVWQCETTDNRTAIEESDAVVFHLRSWTTNDLPERRLPHQRYVFWSMESPAWREFANADQMANFFNWTMTYRWDSDVVGPYGNIKPIGSVQLHPSQDEMKIYLSDSRLAVNYAKGKTRSAAWMVSNCNAKSSRNELVKKLQKYIDVDVYGKCGTMQCSRTLDEKCRDMVATDYKFYMSLENSLCLDYVTEKFFRMIKRPVLPIVYSVHDDHEKMAPTHSFINAAKFENVEKLADYLILLDTNDTLYNEYFWWKPLFQVTGESTRGMCRLCAALHDDHLPSKIYRDMTQWWEKNATCLSSPHIS